MLDAIRRNGRLAGLVATAALLLGALAVQRSVAEGPPSNDPFGALSPEEKIAAQQRASEADDASRLEYIRSFFAVGRDPGQLPRGAHGVSGPAPASLDAAIKEAVVIAVITTERVEFRFPPSLAGWHAVAAVEQVVKGSPGSAVDVHQTGGPYVDQRVEVLLEDEQTPLLLKGDRAVVFLIPGGKDVYNALRVFGQYRIVGNRVYAIEHNEAKTYDGIPLDDFLEVLRGKTAK